MPHPQGSDGNLIQVRNSFDEIYQFVGANGTNFLSTTGESMTARQGMAGDGVTPIIVLEGERHVHGRVCVACWGYQTSCTGERIGQAVIGIDGIVNI